MEVVLDLRCLQDPLLAQRGVGRYAREVLRRAPRGRARLTGLLDPASPPLEPDVRSALHGVRHTAYTGALEQRTILVSFSPFTHDPLFTARLLHHPAVFGVAVVDSLSPPSGPERCEAEADARLGYHVSLRWLARNRLFLLTHAQAGAALGRTLGVQPGEIVETGGQEACDPAQVAERFWEAVLGRATPRTAPAVQRGARPRLAVVLPGGPDGAYGQALCRALRRAADVDVLDTASEPSSPLPFLSSDYDRVVLFGNAGLAARRHLMRYGGAWLGDLDGALPDGEVQAVAEPVLLHSPAAVRALAGAHDGALHLPCGLAEPALPRAPRPASGTGQVVLAVLDAHGAGAALGDCVWALELLRAWGVDAVLHVPPGPVPDGLRALCASLGVAAHVRFGGAAPPVEAGVGLDVRAGAYLGGPVALVGGLAAGLRCVASASLVEAAGAPGWACPVPDNLSPVRLAEAVLHALNQPRPTEAERQAYADARSMDRTAACLLRLLRLGP